MFRSHPDRAHRRISFFHTRCIIFRTFSGKRRSHKGFDFDFDFGLTRAVSPPSALALAFLASASLRLCLRTPHCFVVIRAERGGKQGRIPTAPTPVNSLAGPLSLRMTLASALTGRPFCRRRYSCSPPARPPARSELGKAKQGEERKGFTKQAWIEFSSRSRPCFQLAASVALGRIVCTSQVLLWHHT